MRSIEHFGFTNPVLIDGAGGVIAGHGRVEAAKCLGWKSVPAICLSDPSEEDIRAYVIADNRLAENAGWDSRRSFLTSSVVAERAVSPASRRLPASMKF